MKNNDNTILLVMEKNEIEQMKNILQKVLKDYNVQLIAEDNSLDGLSRYIQYNPCLLITSANMSFLNGFSISAIIKGTEYGRDCSIWLLIDDVVIDAKVDLFIRRPIREDLVTLQIQNWCEKRFQEKPSHSILMAKIEQAKLFPQKIQEETFYVDYIYSPFNELSGDGLDFWLGQNKDGLYGFLFDCTGHDITSYGQVREIRMVLKNGFKVNERRDHFDLGSVMQYLNEELFCCYGNNVNCVAAVAFHLDFRKNKLYYCSAGMPSFFVKYNNKADYQGVLMTNYLIGYRPDADFNADEISLENVENIVFSSDGLSEMVFKHATEIKEPKPDDVTAILISLIKNKTARKGGETNEICNN